MNKTQSNIEAVEYYKSIAANIEDFCKPLNDYLGIALFTYGKVYSDGSYIRLTNNIKLAQEYYSNIDNDCFYFQQYLENENNFILWPMTPSCSGMKLHFENGYWNGFTNIISKCENNIESASFAALRDNHNINEFFIKHHNILQKFIENFKVKFADIISRAERNRASYRKGFNFYLPERKEIVIDIQKFLSAASIDNSNIKIKDRLIHFTPREIQCLKLLEQGHSIKGISKELNLSPRTIEVYMNYIKQKSGYSYKYDLIKMYRDFF